MDAHQWISLGDEFMKSFEIFWKNYQIGMYAEIEGGLEIRRPGQELRIRYAVLCFEKIL